MPSNIVLTKGELSVTIYIDSVSDGIKNQLLVLPVPTVSQNQENGPDGTNIADLLRVTRTFLIKGYIENNTNKGYLMNIAQGGGINGGEITMTYSEGGDKTTFIGYLQSVLVTQDSSDEGSSVPSDFPKFSTTVTFIEGVKMAGS